MTPAQLLALKTEISLPAYAGMDEPTIANALNAKTIAADVDVALERAKRVIIGRNVLGKVMARIAILSMQIQAVYQKAADGAANVGAAATAVQALNIAATETKLAKLYNAQQLFGSLVELQMTDAATKTFVGVTCDDLVAESVMSAADKTAVIVLSDGFISRAEQMYGRGVTIESGDVSRAKKV